MTCAGLVAVLAAIVVLNISKSMMPHEGAFFTHLYGLAPGLPHVHPLKLDPLQRVEVELILPADPVRPRPRLADPAPTGAVACRYYILDPVVAPAPSLSPLRPFLALSFGCGDWLLRWCTVLERRPPPTPEP